MVDGLIKQKFEIKNGFRMLESVFSSLIKR